MDGNPCKSSGRGPDQSSSMATVPTPPRVSFVKPADAALEFEAIALSGLYRRRREIRPHLDRPHRVEFHNLIIFTKGAGKHIVDFQPYDYTEGSVCLIRQGQVHAFELDPEQEGVLLLFTEEFISKNLTQSDALALNRFYGYDVQSPMIDLEESVRQSLAVVTEEIVAEYQAETNFGREEALRLLLKLVLLKIERARRTKLPAAGSLARLRNFGAFQTLLLTHLTRTRNAQDYAKLLGITYRQLNQMCKAVTGQTTKSYIDASVILEAKRRLVTTAISIKELSFDLGFDDPTNFTQFFKKQTGELPAKFRRSLLA